MEDKKRVKRRKRRKSTKIENRNCTKKEGNEEDI